MTVRTDPPQVLAVLLFAFAAALPAEAQEQADDWMSSFTRRDQYTFIAIDPFDDRVLYAGTASTGVFKSTDGGRTWKSASRGLERPDEATVGARCWEVNRIATDPRRRGVLYVASSSGLFRSKDGAATWLKVDLRLRPYSPITSIAQDPSDDKTLYVGTSEGIFKSTDTARTWSSANSGLPETRGRYVSGVEVDPHRPKTLYALVGNRVFRSSDAAESWEDASRGINERGHLQSIAVDPMRPGTIYLGTLGYGVLKSTDSGANWAAAETGFHPDVWAFAFDRSKLGLVYAADSGHVLRSTDGSRWVALGPSVTSGARIDALAVTRRDPRHLYISSPASLFESNDGAASWRVIPPLSATIETLRIHPGDARVVFAGSIRGGVLKSIDAGEHWTTIGLETCEVRCLLVGSGRRELLLAGTSDGVFRSTDAGRHWTASNKGIGCGPSNQVSVTALESDGARSPAFYVAISGAYLYRSNDLGLTWQSTGISPSSWNFPRIDRIAVDPSDLRHLVVSVRSFGLLESLDAGESWSPTDSAIDDMPAPTGHKMKSSDETWPRILAIAWGRSGVLYGAAPNRVFSRPTGEQGWVEVLETGPREVPVAGPGEEPPIEFKCHRMILAQEPSLRRLMVSCDDDLSLGLDDGESWQDLPDLPPQAVNWGAGRFYDDGREIRAMGIRGDLLFVANGYGLFRSRDAGATWEVVIPYRFGPLAPLPLPPAAP